MAKNTNYFIKLDLLVLSMLKDKDMYVYEMVKYLKSVSNGMIFPKSGTIYPVISSLSENHYISTYKKEVNNKIRVYFHIEEAGKEYLKELLDEYDNLVSIIDFIVHGGHYDRK